MTEPINAKDIPGLLTSGLSTIFDLQDSVGSRNS